MRDVLTDVLNMIRLRSTVYCQSEIRKTNWALRFDRIPCAAFHIVVEGSCLVSIEGVKAPTCLTRGDLLVLPHGSDHLIADEAGAPQCAVIHLDELENDTCMLMQWGDSGPQTTLVCGMFDLDTYDGRSLLQVLPEVIHLDAAAVAHHGIRPSVEALIEEANGTYPGREIVLNRLADVLFIKVIRMWLSTPSNQTAGWLRALNDPHLARALGKLHAAPEQAWTVASLAAEAAMSRSAFAARFAEVVGETPFEYVTQWRMRVAAELLRNSNRSLTEIASQVGYQSDLTFSRAFRRHLGTSPARYRRTARPSS